MISRCPSLRRARFAAAACSAAALFGAIALNSARAADCQPAQLATAVDAAGEKLRQLTSATQPTLQARLRQLKEVKGWSDTEYEEKGYAALEDARTRAEVARSLGVHESTISRRVDKLAHGLRKQILSELGRRGMTRRQAEEALDTDVRDLRVDLRVRLAQESPIETFSSTGGSQAEAREAKAGEAPK